MGARAHTPHRHTLTHTVHTAPKQSLCYPGEQLGGLRLQEKPMNSSCWAFSCPESCCDQEWEEVTRAQCFLSDKAVSPCKAWPPPSGQPPRPPPREPCPRKGLLGGKSLLQISRGLCLPPCPPECPQQSQEMQASAHPGVPPGGSACLRAPPGEQKACLSQRFSGWRSSH